MDLIQENADFSESLKGRRLICEANFEQEKIDELRQGLLPLGIQIWSDYPALAAVITVGTGIYHYNSGEFWSAFPGLKVSETHKWGEQFEKFLKKHQTLETFRSLTDEGALRYVAPILAHGGIPQNCLSEFFNLITKYVSPDQSGHEAIEFFKEDNYSKLNYIDKPTRRFLKYGGEVAESFITRFLALWQSRDNGSSGSFGLPKIVVEAFSSWYAIHKPAKIQRRQYFPSPGIYLDPYNLDVVLYLPRCDDNPIITPEDYWHTLGKKWATTRAHNIPLSVYDSLVVIISNRNYDFPVVNEESPALFFDTNTGKAIPDPMLRRLPVNVWAVYRNETNVEPKPICNEKLSRWPGFKIGLFDLTDKNYLRIGFKDFEVRRPFFHDQDDPLVTGVYSLDELPVFNRPPQITWDNDREANLSLTIGGKPQGNIDIHPNGLPILIDKNGDYEILLRGPLGENISKHFILVSNLQVQTNPQIYLPTTHRVEWNITVDTGEIRSAEGCPLTFITSSEPEYKFQVHSDSRIFNLLAKLPKLQWRVVIDNENLEEWTTKELKLRLQDLSKVNYPELVCDIGPEEMAVEAVLLGKHTGKSAPLGRHIRTSGNNIWSFDLREIRNELERSGETEEYNLLVKSHDGGIIFQGPILSIRPEWDLSSFKAHWKKWDNHHQLNIIWQEHGNVITGRWLVIYSLWRLWDKPIFEYLLKDAERNNYKLELPLSDLHPGRYVIKAIHAPCGCDNWLEATSTANSFIDIYPESWPERYTIPENELTIENYLEFLLAHWYRPQLIKLPPPVPCGLLPEKIKNFMDYLNSVNTVERIVIPKDESGTLNIFCNNPDATSEYFLSLPSQELPEIWHRVLPSFDIIRANPNEKDRDFIWEVAFQYSVLNTAANSIKSRHKRKRLSDVFKVWHKNLSKIYPPVDEIIFLCEKFRIFKNKSSWEKREYADLKSTYQCREAI